MYNTKISNIPINSILINQEKWKKILNHNNKNETFINEKKENNINKINQIIQIEEEKKNLKKIIDENNKKIKNKNIIEKAQNIAIEELEEVKTMNKEVLAAKIRTLRDAQLIDKKMKEEKQIEEENNFNEIMKEYNSKAIQIYEEREKLLKEQRILGKKDLEEQINQNKEKKKKN